MKTVRLGMLGAGFVANFYMLGLKDVPGQEVKLVYSRTKQRADAFARQWSIPESTDDLDAAINRDDIDLY
ncbi:MAG TPA: Gfo/Idh/MocA family oxidoreductase, partial [Limnochordales bacterium]